MRVLFKQATESVAKNFASTIKSKYGLELESTEQIRRLIQEGERHDMQRIFQERQIVNNAIDQEMEEDNHG